jgi:hypothetical protein
LGAISKKRVWSYDIGNMIKRYDEVIRTCIM